jgi:uncharacterized cupin superfamily protein
MKSETFRVQDLQLEPYPVDPARVSEGTSLDYVFKWRRDDESEVRGVWQMSPGVLTGVKGDEMFVVIEGRATLEFSDGRIWEIGPGDVGITVPGDLITWTVHETIRKAFTIRYDTQAG